MNSDDPYLVETLETTVTIPKLLSPLSPLSHLLRLFAAKICRKNHMRIFSVLIKHVLTGDSGDNGDMSLEDPRKQPN